MKHSAPGSVPASRSTDSLPAGAESEQLAEVLDRYVADLERGRAPSLEELTDAYPALAEVLPEYLEGVRMIQAALVPQVSPPRDKSAIETASPLLHQKNSESLQAPEAMRPQGEQIGDYELIRELGRGGMGVVYEARQVSLNRRVALKVLPFAAVLDERQIARFRTEAQAAAGLHHPNIVPVFAVGQERGVHFYAMQYVDGQSLGQAIDELKQSADAAAGALSDCSDRGPTRRAAPDATTIDAVARGPLSTLQSVRETGYFRRVAELGIQAAEALQHAHDFGVVHRDIKPGNLLIDQRGKLWVTDFGLARVQSEMSVTLPGDVVGTLRYMSPEQARGRGDLIDGRTDVYALGATLYEMVSLRPAHQGEGRQALLEGINAAKPPPPRQLNPAVPVDLETIILRSMEQERDDRYETADQLAGDLRRFLDGRPTIARRPNLIEVAGKWLARRRRVALASAGILLSMTLLSTSSALWVAAAGRRTSEALAASEASRSQAEAHYTQARRVVDHFAADLADRLAELPGADPLRQELLNDTLSYYEAFINNAGGDAVLQDDLASTHFKSGAIAQRLGNLGVAKEHFRQSVSIWRAQEGGDAQRESLALGLAGLACVEGELGEYAASDRHFSEAVQIEQRLVARQPGSVAPLRALAETLTNFGAMLRHKGESANATERFRDSIRCLQSALEAAPEDVRTLRRLAVANSNLSDALRATSPDEAFLACRDAVSVMERLVAARPREDGLRADLAMTRNNLSALEGAGGDWRRAADGYLLAKRDIEQLVRRNPLVPRHRRELAIAQSNLGLALARTGDHQASEAAFLAAGETLESLVADFPQNPIYRSSLAALHNNRGVAARGAGEIERAIEAFAEAVERQEQIVASVPHQAEQAALLMKLYDNYLDTLREAGREDELKVVEAKEQTLASRIPEVVRPQ